MTATSTLDAPATGGGFESFWIPSFTVLAGPAPRPPRIAPLADRHRMVVAVNYDTDIGDAWEYADSPEYPEAMTTLAYRYGINYLIYAMTH